MAAIRRTKPKPLKLRLGLQTCFLLLCLVVMYVTFLFNVSSIHSVDSSRDEFARASSSASSAKQQKPPTRKTQLATNGFAQNSTNYNNKGDEPPLDRDERFFSYQMYREYPYNVTYGPFTQCHLGRTTNKWGRKPIDRVPLSQPFVDVLNMSTYFQTNLRILTLGDSVGIQFHQLMEEAAGATWNDRKLYTFAWGAHESVSISAPVQGGGVLGAFRMTGMFLQKGLGKPPPNGTYGRISLCRISSLQCILLLS